jgi:arylformamidase
MSVFLSAGRTREELDADYSPSRFVPSLPAVIADWAERSAAVEQRFAPLRRTRSYGPHPREAIDYYATGPAGAPLLVFIHGGFWQQVSKAEAGFVLGHWPQREVHVAILDYALAPEVSLPEITAQARRGLRWLLDHATEMGFDPARMVVAGHSAGAHLAAMAHLPLEDDPPVPMAGLALLSGVFELEPVRRSYVNAAVRMTETEAARLSPLRHRPAPVPLLVAVGEREPVAFHEQSRAMAWAWREAGCPTEPLFLPRHDHFSLLDDAAEPSSVLGQAILRLL